LANMRKTFRIVCILKIIILQIIVNPNLRLRVFELSASLKVAVGMPVE
jgi:hypothetical protein